MTALTQRQAAPWLWILLGLFCLRVIAQPLSKTLQSPLLGEFDTWHSGVIAYPVLLMAQLAIVAGLSSLALAFSRGAVIPNVSLGRWFFYVGVVYLCVMLVRLALGLTVLAGSPWFASPLPTIFHCVLACFLILVGRTHLSEATQ